ncbi:hypothetical protein [Vibrio salinus]|uniref:hypothetical protein n=1 Tax=Vibrio salinus TaxID=2899784 RepID=UPI001E53CF78|nr:hypothetical protein [Vibrio salinus]MCE0494612.1 hypothetical protein [Vibrio salinus]
MKPNMRHHQNTTPVFSLPEYSDDDIQKKIDELSKPKLEHFNRWFRTEFVIYMIAGCCSFMYISPYFLHFIMSDYSRSYWSEQVYSLTPVWIILSSILGLTAAPYSIFRLKLSYKDAEYLIRREKCRQQYRHGSVFVKKQINDYCLSVYKSR